MIGNENINCKFIIFHVIWLVIVFFFCCIRKKIDEFIKNHSSSQACKQPNLPVYAPELMKFVKQEKQIDCSSAGSDWVVCEVSYY